MKTGKFKKWLSVAVIAFLCCALAAPLGLVPEQEVLAASKKKSETVEGDGYKTPEDALIAYAEAMKNQDMDAMLSTFAVESYVKNYDFEEASRRAKSFFRSTGSNTYIHAKDKLSFSKNVEQRRRFITSAVDNQLLTLTILHNYGENIDEELWDNIVEGKNVTFTDDAEGVEDIEEIIEVLQEVPDYSKMKIGKIYYAECMSDVYLDSQNLNTLYNQAMQANADGIKSLGLHVTIGDMEVVLFMDVICYDGHWYNMQSQGNLASISGNSSFTGGLSAVTEETMSFPDGIDSFEDYFKALDEKMTDTNGIADDLKKQWEQYHEEFLSEYEGMSQKEIKETIKEKAETSLENSYLPAAAMTYDEMIKYFALSEL